MINVTLSGIAVGPFSLTRFSLLIAPEKRAYLRAFWTALYAFDRKKNWEKGPFLQWVFTPTIGKIALRSARRGQIRLL